MIKRLVLVIGLLVVGAVSAIAAPMAGKVTAVQGSKVDVTVQGKLEPWVRKGMNVKIFGGKGVITAVVAGKVTIALPKAPKAKVGDDAEFDKAKAAATGC